jgi:hypothetical protein
MCWKIIAIITENARNNTHKNNNAVMCYSYNLGLLSLNLGVTGFVFLTN